MAITECAEIQTQTDTETLEMDLSLIASFNQNI